MFEYLKSPRNVVQYTLMRGVTDFSNMKQFNMFEGGRPLLIVVSIPEYLKLLASKNPNTYGVLIDNYVHVLEYEFKGISGIDNLSSETQEISNNIASVNMITKVTMQSAITFSMNYTEKAGSLITKTHTLYLTGINDPRSNFKHYHGLIESGDIAPEDVGYEKELFSFLYLMTDNTGRLLEKAYFIVAAQPTGSFEGDLYNTEKGDNSFKEVSVEFNGFLITNSDVDKKAKTVLDWTISGTNENRIHLDSNEFKYMAQDDIVANK